MSQSISLSLKQVIVTPLLGLFALFVSAVDATEESQSLDKRQAAMIPIVDPPDDQENFDFSEQQW